MSDKTPYEMLRERRLNITHFHPFGCEYLILNSNNQLKKFDSKVDESIFF